MRTSEIAERLKVHPNTVRLYEKMKFISPVPRNANGYREYSELHLKQMQIARLAFRQEFLHNNLRKRAKNIVRLSGAERFKESLHEAMSYLASLQTEYLHAREAVEVVKQLLRHKPGTETDTAYSHKEAAAMLQLTEETLRNWERNGLYSVARDSRNRRIYTERDIQKLLIIRTLRSAHFSIVSIARIFRELERTTEQPDLLQLLKSPAFITDFFHVTDDLLNQLQIAMKDVEEVISLLQQLQ